MAKTIAIVGAGAKAAAIVARAAILRDLDVKDVPNTLVFEAEHIGSAWSGKGGYSSGFLTLCTPGEKDVGFPYADVERRNGAKEAIATALFARYSWAAYLVAIGEMSDWIDRGRNHPTHRKWADYLEWIFNTAGQRVISAKVTAVRPTGSDWEISFIKNRQSNSKLVHGVVLTGTGRANSIPCAPEIPKNLIFDSETFWPARDQILKLEEGTIVVVGDGGAAGTIVAWLAERFAERPVAIVSVNPMGTLFPRGDGHAERRWFSDPSDWQELSMEHRRRLLERTEAGVVSMRNKRLIDLSPNVEYRWGKALEAHWDGDEMFLDIEYEGQPMPRQPANYLINTIGFDSWSLLELVEHSSVASLCAPGGGLKRNQVGVEMMEDLTLPSISGLPPGLHVPALAGLAHGPGMSNLGCLGLMAAAVLKRYVTK
jgi:mycobactin lysine-N-oxygenase